MKSFRPLFVMLVLMIIGAALITKVDTAVDPRPVQGKVLTIKYNWRGAPAKVVEQNATSVIEGLVSSVRDVAKTESTSRFGSGRVNVELKPGADVSAVRFEIASLLRQTASKLPKEMTYPEVSGGDVVNESRDDRKPVTLLTYRIAEDIPTDALREYVKNRIEPQLTSIDEIYEVNVSGGTDVYMEITYDPMVLASYGITSAELKEAVKQYIGEKNIVGEISHLDKRMALWLTTDAREKPLEHLPIKQRGKEGSAVYLNDIATYRYLHKEPSSYFRINGMSTVYINVIAEAGSNMISLSDDVQRKIDETLADSSGPKLQLTYDAAERQRNEMAKLVGRSLMSLLILLIFVLATSRNIRYTCIVGLTMAASVLISVTAYYLMDIRLHLFSLAGITVSFGLIIDASIVMIDHYRRYHDRGAFFGILAALLTTVGSLVLIFFMPDYIRHDLTDFAWIVIINLTVALGVAYFFVPALVDRFGGKEKRKSPKSISKIRARLLLWWERFYGGYIRYSRKLKWVLIIIFAATFGYTLMLFAGSLDHTTYMPPKPEMKLYISGKLPLGGTPSQLNEKVLVIDEFLKTQDGIKRWETTVSNRGARITVEFEKEALGTSLPYKLETSVIGKLIDTGGADWTTYGVSERGFSNSLNLSHRSHTISVSGYNYERLMRVAETLCDTLSKNRRVADITIQTPNHEDQEDEYYIEYDFERMAAYSLTPQNLHASLSDILTDRNGGRIDDGHKMTDVTLRPRLAQTFDLWQLNNAYIRVDTSDVRVGDIAAIGRRQAKNIIEKRNQEYVLNVAFNIIGSYTYASKYIDRTVQNFRSTLPVGYKCEVATYGWYEDTGEQYWLLGIVVVIIYMLCGILFESWIQPLVIISLIPVSFIGVFLAFYLSGVPFGTGGFASLVLLCGISVNSGIYIIEEVKKQVACSPKASLPKQYLRAYRHKINAVVLTIISTVVGLVPFMLDGPDEKFWYSFAFGTIAGLVFSIIALVLVLPAIMKIPSAKAD